MEENSIFSEDMLSSMTFAQDDYLTIFINFSLCIIMSFIVKTFYIRRSFSLTGKMHIGPIIPILSAVVFLVIMVVKSSLALTLGLVGALSIVRFRTPIKEPEELAYLFIAIAMGLGLGADQRIPTLVAGPFILGIMAAFKWAKKESKNKNLYLSLDWEFESMDTKGLLNSINNIIENHVLISDLRRMDVRGKALEATYFIDIQNPNNLSNLIDDLQKSFSGIGVTFIDQNQMPSV